MTIPRGHLDIAERLAVKMTKEGWRSPKRETLVSTKKVLELIDFIFDGIYEQLDKGKSVHIKKQMIFKKIKMGRTGKEYIRCTEKRKGPK